MFPSTSCGRSDSHTSNNQRPNSIQGHSSSNVDLQQMPPLIDLVDNKHESKKNTAKPEESARNKLSTSSVSRSSFSQLSSSGLRREAKNEAKKPSFSGQRISSLSMEHSSQISDLRSTLRLAPPSVPSAASLSSQSSQSFFASPPPSLPPPKRSPARTSTKRKHADISSHSSQEDLPSPRARKNSSTPPKKLGDEDPTCPICCEAWTTTGTHRICCLKCGHLFGKNCVEKWLKTRKSCPTCNAKASKNEVRVLYNCRITAVEVSSDIQITLQLLKREQQERVKLERECAKLKWKCEMLQTKEETLTAQVKKLEEQNRLLRTSPPKEFPETGIPLEVKNESLASLPLSQSHHTSPPSTAFSPLLCQSRLNQFFKTTSPPPLSAKIFGTSHTFALQWELEVEGGRVMDWNETAGHLFVSAKTNSSSHGIKKISAMDPLHSEFIPLHSLPVRDVKVSPWDSSMVLSTSMDRSLVLTHSGTRTKVLQFKLSSPSFVCEWNRSSEHYFYAAQPKALLLFDLRQTAAPVGTFPAPYPHPTQSLQFIPSSSSALGENGLISASGGAVSYWSVDNYYKTALLPLEGNFSGVRYHPPSLTFLASLRSSKLFPKPSHTIKELRTLYHEALPPVCLTRSALFEMSTASSLNPSPESRRLIVASGDETSFQVNLWDAKNGSLVQQLPPHSSAVMDLHHIGDLSVDFLCSLSEKQIRVYKLRPV